MKEKKQIIEKLENKSTIVQEPLTFLDGILITKKIYDTVLKKQLSNEKGEPEKDNDGYDYLGIINDDVTGLLKDKILEHGYFIDRSSQLTNRFGINL